jgi:hypothetical protein
MIFRIQKCFTCGALGVGPHKVKLWPFESRMYCREHYQEALGWDESRGQVIQGIKSLHENYTARPAKIKKYKKHDWKAYIQECAEFASIALVHQDRRTFVHYFARAIYAWALQEERQ